MKAAVVHELNRPLRLDDVPVPTPETVEVLIEVESVAVDARIVFDLREAAT